MTELALPILIAVVAGIAVALQGQFMGTMDRTAGTITSVFITYGVGGAIAATIWLARGGPLQNVRQVPWYAWTAGALGLVIVGGIGYAAPRLGLARTLVITIAAQLLAALLIDRTLDAPRAIGFALTVAGVWLIVR
ncbi:MAG TPA: DMT family transporter [Thermoanaerobaculia bacterium]|nr:DMT family transporter [Thermoanaerobaculia bacterium]